MSSEAVTVGGRRQGGQMMGSFLGRCIAVVTKFSCPAYVWGAMLHAALFALAVPSFGGSTLVFTAFALEVATAGSLMGMWSCGMPCGQMMVMASGLITVICCNLSGVTTGMAEGVSWANLAHLYLHAANSSLPRAQKYGVVVAGVLSSVLTSGGSNASLVMPGLLSAMLLGRVLGTSPGMAAIKRGMVCFHALAVGLIFAKHASFVAQGWRDGRGMEALTERALMSSIALMAVVIDVFSIVQDRQHLRFIADVLPKDAASWLIRESAKRGTTTVPMGLLKDIATSLPYHRSHESVTVFFMDIVGYTALSSDRKPLDTMGMLHEFYCYLDWHARDCEVYKVETIGDCYMVACGLEDSDPADHADHVLVFAQRVLHVAQNLGLTVRIGIDSGPITSGIVGLYRHRFCLFGDTVNTASRMETSAVHNGIHISDRTYDALRNKSGLLGTSFGMTSSRIVKVKGKGTMCTYDVAAMAGGEFTRGPKTERESPPPEADAGSRNEELREALLSPSGAGPSPADAAALATGLKRPSFGKNRGLFGSAVDLTALDTSEATSDEDSANEAGDRVRDGFGMGEPRGSNESLRKAVGGVGVAASHLRRGGTSRTSRESTRRYSMTDEQSRAPSSAASADSKLRMHISHLGISGAPYYGGPLRRRSHLTTADARGPLRSGQFHSKSFDVARPQSSSSVGVTPPTAEAFKSSFKSFDTGAPAKKGGDEEWNLLFPPPKPAATPRCGRPSASAPDCGLKPSPFDRSDSSGSQMSGTSSSDENSAPMSRASTRPLKGDSVESMKRMHVLSRPRVVCEGPDHGRAHEIGTARLVRLESYDFEATPGEVSRVPSIGLGGFLPEEPSFRRGRLSEVAESISPPTPEEHASPPTCKASPAGGEGEKVGEGAALARKIGEGRGDEGGGGGPALGGTVADKDALAGALAALSRRQHEQGLYMPQAPPAF